MNEEESTQQDKEEAVTLSAGELQLESLQKQVEELAEFKEKYFRTIADQENARKRLQKERQENAEFAIRGLIVEMLTPLDHFERALTFSEQMSDEIKHWGEGFKMILTQFKDALNTHGVTPIETQPGDAFDPHIHDAIEMVETEKFSPGTIVKISARGYRIGERTLRPARVTVAKEINTEEPEKEK